ncbi:MOR1 [Symbiodinium pilosum]|uniref:MOR1 protein n=1 Tax=Symbiodinium pilosum TaxID=2952 RepID=A0A812Y182_SYMPI|nr:MOR1 [Symbiodinium pilosum]
MTDCIADLESAKRQSCKILVLAWGGASGWRGKKNAGFFKKQLAFIIKMIGLLVADFGIKKLPPKLGYVGIAQKYVADSDRGLRESCYGVFMELAMWLGDISEFTKPLDEPQKKEVAKRLEGVKESEKAAKRRYRGEAAPLASASESMNGKVDPFARLPKGWCISSVTSMEKWKEKLQHLQVLSEILERPAEEHRLSVADGYASLVPTIQRMIKGESNIPVLTEVAKCMGLISKGLRRNFEKHAKALLPVALARITDKSVWKHNCLIDRVEQLLWSVPFEVLLEELPPHIGSKSLFVKKEALNLLLRGLELPQVQEIYPDAFQRFFPAVATLTLPLIDDSDNTVRQEAARVLARLVVENKASNDLSIVLDRLPSHRRAVFEDELKKISKDPLPQPTASLGPSTSIMPELRSVPTPLSPHSRRTSPLKQRLHAVPVVESPQTQEPAPAKSMASTPPTAQTAVASPAIAEAPEISNETNETPLMKQMAEEIRNLRSKERTHATHATSEVLSPAPAGGLAAAPGPVISRLRGPSADRIRVPSLERRDATPKRDPSTRREAMTPTRRQATPTRREPTPTPREVPLRREPTPTRQRELMPREARQDLGAPRRRREPTPRREATPTREQTPRARREPTPMRREPTPRRNEGRDATPTRRQTPRTPSAARGYDDRLSQESAYEHALLYGECVVPFGIGQPKLTKQARQQRERSQYWGPETIPADHLTALREQWRICIEDWLWRQMFTDRLEDQLAGLQHWQKEASDHIDIILEADVLDMLLKWLTWMLTNANTKVWKLVLDVLTVLLQNLERLDVQLTDRETQILVPNIVARSGHNILVIRESMQDLLRLCACVASPGRVLPMLLYGLTSKSKRSAACSMRAIGDILDRGTTLALLRSQKDLGLVLKLTVDKDADVRRSAVHTVSLFSLYVDDDVFIKVCRGLPPLAKGPVQTAAIRLQVPEDEESRPAS